MRICRVEIRNFRKLRSVRIDLDSEQSLLVGANNSGKSSAMLALRRFLQPGRNPFEIEDVTLSSWKEIERIGTSWRDAHDSQKEADLDPTRWSAYLPMLDIWFDVGRHEIHRVRDMIPTLDWEFGLIGVRLQYEPKRCEKLFSDFLTADEAARELRMKAAAEGSTDKLRLWPSTMHDYLRQTFSSSSHFEIKRYPLDPSKIREPDDDGQAQPQVLPVGAVPFDANPLRALIRVSEVPAQRGLGFEAGAKDDEGKPRAAAPLTKQIVDYYKTHLDPEKLPSPEDLGALLALQEAQEIYDKRLSDCFEEPLKELLNAAGYPGRTDPHPTVATRPRVSDQLNHPSGLTFNVAGNDPVAGPEMRLPESSNGLGYQNLIGMIFHLMAYRDGWLRVGKARSTDVSDAPEPIHLVLVEEPEAHLHTQVQQVFIRKAYGVLTKSTAEKEQATGSTADYDESLETGATAMPTAVRETLRTQMVVSTHSSHVVHEVPYACLRHFRRLPAKSVASVPVAAVANLSDVFGNENETERFVKRYLQARHADLFFADAAILVEGAAERMLIPGFIRAGFPDLNRSYVTILEIGGSHAYTLRPLIEKLGLLTLIVTDLDSTEDGSAAAPKRGTDQSSGNTTFERWHPGTSNVDDLLDLGDSALVKNTQDPHFAVRVAYQQPVEVGYGAITGTALPYTFEDALVFENVAAFAEMGGAGLIKKFRDAIQGGGSVAEIGEAFFQALRSGKKAEFALDVLFSDDFERLEPPEYIRRGLAWLEESLDKRQTDGLFTPALTEALEAITSTGAEK